LLANYPINDRLGHAFEHKLAPYFEVVTNVSVKLISVPVTFITLKDKNKQPLLVVTYLKGI